MIASLVYLLVAILVLGFLIFIHELGHYWMARRVGMRVEAFGIGFGKPIASWKHDGVDWRLGWIPFGGYVKIAGQENDENVDPYDVPDSFFGRPPLDRIKVALAGPITNLLFAFLVFGALQLMGGQEKNYSDFTPRIGWVDPHSDLYAAGVRPGDEILSYGDQIYQGIKDHTIAPTTAKDILRVQGLHQDLATGNKEPFDVTVDVYPNPNIASKDIKTAGILHPASYLIYAPGPKDSADPLASGSPLANSGLEEGDRIIWADGEVIYSQQQLSHLINDNRALITVQRGKKTLLRRVPRVLIQDLRIDQEFREELIDWQYEAQLHRKKGLKLYSIPYNVTQDAVVENPLHFIEQEKEGQVFPENPYSLLDEALQVGDKIIAVNGTPIAHAFELLTQIQDPKILLIALRDPAKAHNKETWQQADAEFTQEINFDNLAELVNSIGTASPIEASGNLFLLQPVTPKLHIDFATTPEAQAAFANQEVERRKAVEAIDDPERRAQVLQILEENDRLLRLGPPYFVDHKVVYNPGPIRLFTDVFEEIWHTLKSLVSGNLSPKWLAGPIGIVSIVHDNWAVSVKEGIYWIGAISLNLGFLNLLPIPVLDGGSICFSLWELITRRRIKAKTMERLIIPFAVLLIAFILFLTYQDMIRLFGRLLP